MCMCFVFFACVYKFFLSISICLFLHVPDALTGSSSWPCAQLQALSLYFFMCVHTLRVLQGSKLFIDTVVEKRRVARSVGRAWSQIIGPLRISSFFCFGLSSFTRCHRKLATLVLPRFSFPRSRPHWEGGPLPTRRIQSSQYLYLNIRPSNSHLTTSFDQFKPNTAPLSISAFAPLLSQSVPRLVSIARSVVTLAHRFPRVTLTRRHCPSIFGRLDSVRAQCWRWESLTPRIPK